MARTEGDVGGPGFRGLIFDFEGTLVDFQWRLEEGEAALREAFEALGIPRERLAEQSYSSMWNDALRASAGRRAAGDAGRRAVQGSDTGAAVETAGGVASESLVPAPADVEELRRAVGAVYDRFDVDALSRWELRPGAAATLAALRSAGSQLAVVSNIGRVALAPALAKLGIDTHIPLVLSRDDVAFMKPESEGIERVLATWGLSAAEVLFVGDSCTDVAAARAAGIKVAILSGGESTAEALEACPPDFRVAGLADLEPLVVSGAL